MDRQTDTTIVVAFVAAAKALALAAKRDVRTPRGVKIVAGSLLDDFEEAMAAAKRLEGRGGGFVGVTVHHSPRDVFLARVAPPPAPIKAGDALSVDSHGRLVKAAPGQLIVARMIEDHDGSPDIFMSSDGRAANTMAALEAATASGGEAE